MKKAKLVLVAVLFAGFCATLSGCFTTNVDHDKKHFYTWWKNVERIHEEIDYFFFDYSPTDPYAN